MVQLDLFRNRTGEYNVVYKYHWKTRTTGLPHTLKHRLDETCEGAWGWHFIREHSESLEENVQQLVITFEDPYDLINAKFMEEL